MALASSVVSFGLVSSGQAIAAEKITYAQILNDPSNLDLNLAYAQQRIDEGNLVSAAATLERILFTAPNWDDARLLYAGVLYRLGDYDAARREISLLDGRQISEDSRAQLEAYESRIDQSDKKTRWSGRLSLGASYDENAAVLITEDVGGDPTQSDLDQFSFVARASLGVETDVSDTSNVQVFGRADLYTKQFEDAELDGYIITTGRAGFRGSSATLDYQANLVARNANIQGANYMTEVGIEGSLARDFAGKTAVGVLVSYHDQDFNSIFGPGDATEGRTGDRVDGSLFVKRSFGARTRATVRLDARDKSADLADFAYTFVGGQISADHFFRNSSYLDGDVIYREYDYDGNFGGPTAREDEYTFARLAAGVPMAALASEGSRMGDCPIVVEAAVYVTDRQSNVDAFKFDSTGGEIRLIWNMGQ